MKKLLMAALLVSVCALSHAMDNSNNDVEETYQYIVQLDALSHNGVTVFKKCNFPRKLNIGFAVSVKNKRLNKFQLGTVVAEATEENVQKYKINN